MDDEQHIDTMKEGDHVTLRVEVNPLDTGKVIGKKGATARSIRTLMSIAAMKEKFQVSIDIVSSSTG